MIEWLENLENKNLNMVHELSAKDEVIKKLKRDITTERTEIVKLKEEKDKINKELVNLQVSRDKIEAKEKSEEKLKKIKKNTKLFNKIIANKLETGELKDIDIAKYINEDMEECDGDKEEIGYESLNELVMNKDLGGKRSSPQEESVVKHSKVLRCPQCDFISQNENHFNEHISKVHASQPTCPFCFKAFKTYSEVRRHCENNHSESKNNGDSRRKMAKKKPCRYYRNGEGNCSPPSGFCSFDHSIIPDNQRELCRHKQACKYKPYCIFLHPEGQLEQEWQPVRKNPARICVFSVNGGTCMKSICNFFHPTAQRSYEPIMKSSDFHQQSVKEPPLYPQSQEGSVSRMSIDNLPLLPMRVPVIVRNKQSVTDSMMKSLSQNMKEAKIV